MLILNSKHVQHVKINIAYNFEVKAYTLYRCFLPSLVPFGPVVSEE
jgi:hypothetical protein